MCSPRMIVRMRITTNIMAESEEEVMEHQPSLPVEVSSGEVVKKAAANKSESSRTGSHDLPW